MKYTLIEKILVQGIAFLQGVILARLLSPSDFGLAAMLGLFLMVGGSLAESGLGSAYVVYGGDTRRVLKWNLSAALLIYLALAFAAPFIAAFYHEPILRELTWVMGIGIVINAATVVDYARLQREKRFAALSFVNTSVTLGAFLLALIFALSGFGVWTIAWMSVGAALLKLLTLKLALHHSQFNTNTSTLPSDFSKLISYGLKTMISGLIHTVYLNSYQLIIGKTANPAAVGLFSRGQRWAALPVDIINESVARVAFPNLVSGDVAGRRLLLLNAALLWPSLALLWLFAPELIGFVFGSAWLEAVPYLRILILGVLFTPFGNVALNYLRARGRADLVLVTDAIKKPLQIAALVCGVCVGTVEALCWAKVVSDIFEAVVDFLVAWWCRWSKEYMWSHAITLTGTKTGELLKASHESGALRKMLEGKTIAVVGNGPSELKKGLGEEIDAHDIVIRINNFKLKGYEADYGKRTDIWMKCGADDIKHKFRKGVKAILYTDDPLETGILRHFAKYPGKELKKGIVVDYIERSAYVKLEEKIGARPSSGAVLIDYLRGISAKSVDVYGFAFLESRPEDNEDGFIHYTGDIDPIAAKRIMIEANHSAAKETAYLSGLFTSRRLMV